MAKLYNLARVSTATSGTGTITLGAAVSGYLTFALAGVSDADVVDYAIKDGANSEIGTGTYTAAGTTLTRTVLKSTNSNNAISLSGSAEVFISPNSATLQQPDFRNLIVNGAFAVWQRGAGGAASIAQAASLTAYNADRWFLITNATQASVISQQAGLITGSRWSARILRNSGQTGTGVMRFEYPLTVDECITLRGQFLSLQFWASSGANWSPTSGTVNVNAYFGTGTEGKRGAGSYTGETNPLTSHRSTSRRARRRHRRSSPAHLRLRPTSRRAVCNSRGRHPARRARRTILTWIRFSLKQAWCQQIMSGCRSA
jgi:hypothetical protein